jgi:hypothetical protein
MIAGGAEKYGNKTTLSDKLEVWSVSSARLKAVPSLMLHKTVLRRLCVLLCVSLSVLSDCTAFYSHHKCQQGSGAF